MKSDNLAGKKDLTPEELEGYKRAHLAALYANFRMLLAWSRLPDPLVGLFGVGITQRGSTYFITAGATPPMATLLSGLGSLQGHIISNAVDRKLGGKGNSGDQFDPATGKVHCIGCEDGDPTGDHAQEELRENALAWLGVVVGVAQGFYSEHLPPEAHEHLQALAVLALPADTKVQ